MATFSISAMAAQCGVTTANIRSWERYGLLEPVKDEAGNRFYCIEDVIRIQHIIDALSKGFSLKEISPPSMVKRRIAALDGYSTRRRF